MKSLILGVALAAALVGSIGRARADDPKFEYGKVADVKDVKAIEWKAAAEAGLIFTTGNSETITATGGLKASRKKKDNKLSIEAAAAFAKSSVRALVLPILPVRNTVLFPHVVTPLFVDRDRSLRAIEESMGGERTLDEPLSREEALIAHTRSNAHLMFRENDLGSVRPGLLADLLVLDRDYLTVPADEIRDITPVATMVGGRVVHGSLAALLPCQHGNPAE